MTKSELLAGALNLIKDTHAQLAPHIERTFKEMEDKLNQYYLNYGGADLTKIKPTYEEAKNLILNEHLKWIESDGKEGVRLNLSCANLMNVNFRHANFRHANFSFANLACANLIDASVLDAYFTTADLPAPFTDKKEKDND